MDNVLTTIALVCLIVTLIAIWPLVLGVVGFLMLLALFSFFKVLIVGNGKNDG